MLTIVYAAIVFYQLTITNLHAIGCYSIGYCYGMDWSCLLNLSLKLLCHHQSLVSEDRKWKRQIIIREVIK